MNIRKAKPSEWDEIFLMGFSTWGDGLAKEDYLKECHESEKYQQGHWYVLEKESKPVSSLIIYENLFNLPEACFGIGSVATHEDQYRRGYASKLVKEISKKFKELDARGIFLFSDINPEFYRKLGFESITANQPYDDTTCMVLPFKSREHLLLKMPDYF
ncbi:hypothetical protein GZ78_06895 [Endozoicomonas numazuensis]|uniref:N-acetyltransferase domain-containing protein n=1 Tax=Endozoicomonas numazuensis TaxID=1137799 RepID=A0A081NME4_9GAMM|nr:hypothetical protein GZ78_06895 [Endozoicomonas numazuensis]